MGTGDRSEFWKAREAWETAPATGGDTCRGGDAQMPPAPRSPPDPTTGPDRERGQRPHPVSAQTTQRPALSRDKGRGSGRGPCRTACSAASDHRKMSMSRTAGPWGEAGQGQARQRRA